MVKTLWFSVLLIKFQGENILWAYICIASKCITMDKIKMNTEELITRDEAIQLLKCTGQTFWRFTRAGKIPFYRAGHRMLFKRSEILEAIKVKATTHE